MGLRVYYWIDPIGCNDVTEGVMSEKGVLEPSAVPLFTCFSLWSMLSAYAMLWIACADAIY